MDPDSSSENSLSLMAKSESTSKAFKVERGMRKEDFLKPGILTTNVEAFLRNPADLLLLEEKDKLGIKFGVGVSPRDLVQLNDIAQEVKGQKSGTHPVRFERRPDDYVDVDVRSFAKVNNAIVTAMVRDAAEADGKIWETLDEDERDHYRNVVQKNLAVYKQARAEYLKGNPTSDFAKGSQKEKIELP